MQYLIAFHGKTWSMTFLINHFHFLILKRTPFFLEFIQIVRYIYIHTYWKCRSIPLIKIFTRRIVAPYNFPSMVKKKKEREKSDTWSKFFALSIRLFSRKGFSLNATKKIVLRSSSIFSTFFPFPFLRYDRFTIHYHIDKIHSRPIE